MKVVEFLRWLLSGLEQVSLGHSASCPVCGNAVATSRVPNFDSERVVWACGCKADYISNFPGVTKILITESCKPQEQK